MKDRRPIIYAAVGILALAGGVVAFETQTRNRILPGVVVDGIAVGGLSLPEATNALKRHLEGQVPALNVLIDTQRFRLPASELGWRLDASRTARAALEIGRRGNILTQLQDRLSALGGRVQMQSQVLVDQNTVRSRLKRLAQPILITAKDATITVQNGRFRVEADRPGRTVDLEKAIHAYTTNPRLTELRLETSSVPAQITSATLEPVATQANALLRPISMNYPEPGGTIHRVRLRPEEIAGMLKVQGSNLTTRPDVIKARLKRLALGFDQPARNARYVRIGAELQAKPERQGFKLDLEVAQKLLSDEILRPEAFEVTLPIISVQPSIRLSDLPKAETLSLLAEAYTSYAGSSLERITNVAVAAARLDGFVVPAGETFSFNAAVGPIAPENGFAEGYVISGGRTIKGVGGGVCQASTTTFRAMYKAGLPVVERNQHAYRVRWYDPLVGMDAAVYQPYLDLKMQNDTPGPLLVRAWTRGASMTVQLLGISDGRKVNVSSPVILSRTPSPPVKYEFNPTLPAGTRKQVDWAADGYRVRVVRSVTNSAGQTETHVLASNFRPWRAVYQIGPTPRPANGIPFSNVSQTNSGRSARQ